MSTLARIIYEETGLTESGTPDEYEEVAAACRRFAMYDTETTDYTDLLRQALKAMEDVRTKYSDLIYESNKNMAFQFEEDIGNIEELLQRFAALVATAERRKHQADIERWKAEAATAEKWRGLALSKDGDGRCVRRIQQEAAAKEREACAALCDDIVQEEEGKLDRDYSREGTAEELAVLIRARGQQ